MTKNAVAKVWSIARWPDGTLRSYPPQVSSYSTSFPLTENPISEGGIWTPGSVFVAGSGGVASKTNMQTAPGKAFSSMTVFDGTNFPDSCACLNNWPPNHQVICTVGNSGGFSGFSLELEILLRATINASVVQLYEIDCVFGRQGIQLVRWDMDPAHPNNFTVPFLRAAVADEAPLNDGDQVRAKIVGTVITVDYKRFGGSFVNLFIYDTAGDAIKYSTGMGPGIGGWNQNGAPAQSLLYWRDFAAVSLP